MRLMRRWELWLALLLGAQLLSFWLFLLRTPTGKNALPDNEAASPALRRRRCLPAAHRDSRFVRTDVCVTAPQRLHVLEDLVFELTALLDSAHVVYWLDSGTLLGQYRAQELVPWDYNADVGLTLLGLQLLQRADGGSVRLPEGFELNVVNSSRFQTGECSAAVPVRFVDTTFGFYANLHVFYEVDGDFQDGLGPATDDKQGVDAADGAAAVKLLGTEPSKVWHRCVHCPGPEIEHGEESSGLTDDSQLNGMDVRPRKAIKRMQIPKDWVFPLRPCFLNSFQVMCPAQSVPYLMHLFGDRFRTPELWD